MLSGHNEISFRAKEKKIEVETQTWPKLEELIKFRT